MSARGGGTHAPGRRYRAVLRAYPPAFRNECGADFLRFLGCQRGEERYRGPLGALRFWREVIGDALRTGVRMRFGRGGGRPSPPRLSSTASGSFADRFVQDVRYAARSLAASPGLTAVGTVTLALGIGANSAIYTVVDSVLFRSLPYSAPHELVKIERSSERSSVTAVSWPDFRDWRTELTSYAGLLGAVHFSTDIQWEGAAESLNGAAISHDTFDVLGVPPAFGRTFNEDEDRIGGPRVIILDHDNFVQRFGGDPDALGRHVLVDGDAHELVGVMPPGFRHPFSDRVEFWIPMRADELLTDSGLPANARGLGFIDVIGRLAPGVAFEEAAAETVAVAARIDAAEQPDRAASITTLVSSLHESTVGEVRSALLVLLAAVGIVLIIACANVANLSLGKVSARRRDLAVRSALGAPRGRLIFQQVAESVLMALAGGALGVLLAVGLLQSLVSLTPSWLPRADEIGVNRWVLAFTVGVSLLAGILAGVLPALRSSRSRAGAALDGGGRSATHGARRLRTHDLLVGTQVALAVVLLTAAALLANSFARLLSVDPGFDPDRMVQVGLSPPPRMHDQPEALMAFYAGVLETARALPRVEDASLTYSPPFAGNDFNMSVVPEGVEEDPDSRNWVGTVIVGDDYFDTLGIPLVRGRAFGAEDRLGGPPVVIINETMADRFWPGEDPLGRMLLHTDGVSGSLGSFDRSYFPRDGYTIVGIVGDVRRVDLSGDPEPIMYRPHAQVAWSSMYLLVRTSEDSATLGRQLQRSIWDIDPAVAIDPPGTIRAWMADNVAEPRFRTVLIGSFALLATSLAMIGVYAVMAWGVTQRVREIGVRMALGAPTGRVLGQVLARGLLITALGAAAGLAAAVALGRLVTLTLYGVTPTDPPTLAVVVGLTIAVSLLACYLPARRASKVDPMTALRCG